MVRQRGTAVVLGLLVLAGASWGDEAAAVKAIEKLGGKITVDDKQPGKPVVAVNLFNTKVTDVGLKELKDLKNLHRLYLADTKVTDAGLKELKELKSLQSLILTGTQVTEAGVKDLKAALPKLEISR